MSSTRNILARSYLGILFRQDKRLFFFVLLFAAGSLFANLIRLETSPFFLWKLYAEKFTAQKTYSIYEVRYNDRLLNGKHTWAGSQDLLIINPLKAWVYASHNQWTDPRKIYFEDHWNLKHPLFNGLTPNLYMKPSDYAAFPSWYKTYLTKISHEPFRNIAVIEKKLSLDDNGGITLLKADTVLFIRE